MVVINCNDIPNNFQEKINCQLIDNCVSQLSGSKNMKWELIRQLKENYEVEWFLGLEASKQQEILNTYK
jgi:hypothetical protein